MRIQTYRSMLLKILLVASFGLITLSNAYGLERIRWKVQHTAVTPLQLQTVERVAENIKIMSGGKLSFRLYKPGSLVPNGEIWNAVAVGQLDAGFSSPGFLAKRIPALSIFNGIPFGPSMTEFTAWMRYGGGQELKDEIYAEKGLKALNIGLFPPETGGWFKKRYQRVDALEGIKMRFMGIGAKVMEKLGVKTLTLSFADIKPAFEKGRIDAAEFMNPQLDFFAGIHKFAKYNYYPGWIQPISVAEFVTQTKKWEGLNKMVKTIIETSCNDAYLWYYVKATSIQPDAMIKLKSEGVTFVTWQKSEINKLKNAWNEVAEEMSSEDPLFAKVYSNLKAFREKYAIWGDRAYLK